MRMLLGAGFPVRGGCLRGALCVTVLLGINATAASWLPGAWLAQHRLLDGARLGWVLGVAAGYLAVSLAQYGLHRAEHGLAPWWWGLHPLHHAPVRMDCREAAFTHPLEVVVSATVFTSVTFANPASFSAAVGFEPERAKKIRTMLAWVDVNRDTSLGRAKENAA